MPVVWALFCKLQPEKRRKILTIRATLGAQVACPREVMVLSRASPPSNETPLDDAKAELRVALGEEVRHPSPGETNHFAGMTSITTAVSAAQACVPPREMLGPRWCSSTSGQILAPCVAAQQGRTWAGPLFPGEPGPQKTQSHNHFPRAMETFNPHSFLAETIPLGAKLL